MRNLRICLAAVAIVALRLSTVSEAEEVVGAGEFVKIYDPSVGEEKRWYINDHCFVRGDDGIWHLFGITHAEPANPLDEKHFAHATAKTLTQQTWQKQPFALSADWENHREAHLWAPHVIHHDGLYYMFYCAGAKDHTKYHIHLASSKDLKSWARHPKNPMVVDGFDARDPFVLRLGDQWVMYYTATTEPTGGNHIVACRTSKDLVQWGERTVAFLDPGKGTYGGPTESPFVVRRGGYFYLLIGPRPAYVGTDVFRSKDPFHWDPSDKVGHIQSHAAEVIRDTDGSWYVSHCGWGKGGVYLAPLVWSDKPSDSSSQAGDHLTGKKVIEWGWDEPDTKFIRENIDKMEQFPFDGLIFHVVSSRGGNMVWEMWGKRKFELSEFRHSMENLKATRFRRFTDRFLRVNVTPGEVDWFDDKQWAVVLNNYEVASRVAKQGGCKGFMFDVEQYNAGLFAYGKQPHKDRKSFAEYRAKVRQRGQEWMRAVNAHFPDITVLLTFGYRITQPPAGRDRSATHYGLLADFLDGMLDACSEKTKIVDAWEYSYSYKKQEQYDEAYKTIKETSSEWTAVPEKYRRHVQAGFGIWMDRDWRGVGWHLNGFSRNYFSPAEFENSVRSALSSSDEYVWIYTEQPRWWTNEKLPKQYVEALSRARQSALPDRNNK